MPTVPDLPVPLPPLPGQAVPPVVDVPIPGGDALGTVADIGASVAAAGAWLANRHNLVRVAYVVVGLVLILNGVVVLAGTNAAVKATKVAGKVL